MALVYRAGVSGTILLSLLVSAPTLLRRQYFFAYWQYDAFDSVWSDVGEAMKYSREHYYYDYRRLFHYLSGK